MLRKRKTYCVVESCINFKGTFDKNEHMFRYIQKLICLNNFNGSCGYSFYLRCNSDNREAWIDAIHNHFPDQKFTSSFYVCIRHFKVSDYTKPKEDKFALNTKAVPSIFENLLQTADDDLDIIERDEETNEVFGETETVNSGSELHETDETIQETGEEANSKIEKLNSEIFKLKLDHDITY